MKNETLISLSKIIDEIQDNGIKLGIIHLSSYILEAETLLDKNKFSLRNLIDSFKNEILISLKFKNHEIKSEIEYINDLLDILQKSYNDGYENCKNTMEKLLNLAVDEVKEKKYDNYEKKVVIKKFFTIFDKLNDNLKQLKER
jgi:hypothetical protein